MTSAPRSPHKVSFKQGSKSWSKTNSWSICHSLIEKISIPVCSWRRMTTLKQHVNHQISKISYGRITSKPIQTSINPTNIMKPINLSNLMKVYSKPEPAKPRNSLKNACKRSNLWLKPCLKTKTSSMKWSLRSRNWTRCSIPMTMHRGLFMFLRWKATLSATNHR